jgi:hypothetical protein
LTIAHISRAGKTDEFYTQLSTIEDELRHYRQYFKDKIVFCNADDPAFSEDGQDHFGDGLGGYTSNFFRYFQLNFEQLGIKKLIATHYDPNKPSYKLELEGDHDNDGKITRLDVVKTPLKQNGDFRSPECLELLRECDIVVTNPPFSLMTEYLPLMVNSRKQFLILGNTNHAILSETFAYLKGNQFWLGHNSGHFWFKVPDYYEVKETDFKIDETGQKWRRMGNICWFTNMDIDKRHQPLDLYMHYTPEKYPKYDQYDAININKTTDIPDNYEGMMGVPITFLDKHSPEQFEIIGVDRYVEDNPHYGHRFTINSKETYARILIRRK